ncbi:hypothetical protein GF380_04815 [Candidatus Uhrbacteria bacterium]|nr:hypothetical protein [Candidatus Uhrbacteria bacterium]MBD3284369.1 hypothetical protein [Candidatus Uhrbacteria bacterium]
MTNLKGLYLIIMIVGALGVIVPNTAEAKITPQTMNECMSTCTQHLVEEAKQACVTIDTLKQCFDTNDACKEWTDDIKKNALSMCDTFGQHLCGCDPSSAKPSSPPKSTPAKKRHAPATSDPDKDWKPSGPPQTATLTEQEGCELRGGVWAVVKETKTECEVDAEKGERVCQDYVKETAHCYTLADAYEDIQQLKNMPAHALTEADIERLRKLLAMDFSKGFPAEHDWSDKRDEIVIAMTAICLLSSEDEQALEAKYKESDRKVDLIAKCEAVRAKIDANEQRSKQNERDIKDVRKTAEVAKQEAGEAKELARDALRLNDPSYLRLSAVGGVHFTKTPPFGDMGDDFVAFGGVEGQWMHPVSPKVLFLAEGGLGYSSKIYGSNAGMTWVGLGLGFRPGKDLILSGNLTASHFFNQYEWSKLNVYAAAPELTWAPGLDNKDSGEMRPALTVRLPLGVARTRIPGSEDVETYVHAGAILGLGIIF